jgi:putative transposase
MPRKYLFRSQECPYHVTARANNRENFPLALEEIWEVFNEHLREISGRYATKIHAFVLMPNHFHLLISTPQEDLGKVMQYFMRSMTKTLNFKTGRSGRIFGAKYHWSLIDSIQYFDCALKYVYRNPVKANLVNSVEFYPYSTLGAVVGRMRVNYLLHPPVGMQSLIPAAEVSDFLNWLNQPFPNEEDREIREGLKKTRFSPLRKEWNKKKTLLTSFNASHHGK